MTNIRQDIHAKAAEFDRRLRAVTAEKRIKIDDPKTFDELWERYADLGIAGQIWSSMNRVEMLLGYGVQLLYRNLEVEIDPPNSNITKELNRVRQSNLFAEKVLLNSKKELFVLGCEKHFGCACERADGLEDFRQLRNMFAHCMIHYSNKFQEYYLQDRHTDAVICIPLGLYAQKVCENLQTVFPWLLDVVDSLARDVMMQDLR